ncbi:MAG: hypothetical protein WBO12_23415 [Xanthobacteraceae bacterium]|jgi:hypothetical protein
MSLVQSIGTVMAGQVEKIHEINRRYATPRIKMSTAVRASLLTLRIYLIVLVGLLVYKFITILTQ